jgi:hypothetical protein
MLISAITQSGAAGRQIGLASAFNKRLFGILGPVGRSRTVNSRVQECCSDMAVNLIWLIRLWTFIGLNLLVSIIDNVVQVMVI